MKCAATLCVVVLLAGRDAAGQNRPLERWFDLQTASFLARYRLIESSTDVVTSNHLQDNIAFRARFKFDPQGRLAVTAGVATGASFISGWNNIGVGTGGPGTANMFLKQLFLAAVPGEGVELSCGGLFLVRGESTEITSYDNDGYVTGERVSVRHPKRLYFDEITVTAGYLGDATMPALTDRTSRLAEWNYGQALVRKKLSKRIAVSSDYVRSDGVSTLRSAVTITDRAGGIVRYEQYKRFGATGAFGFAAYGERAIGPRLSAGFGYADIDAAYGGLNADRYQRGRRLIGQAGLKIARDLSASLFVTEAVHNAYAVTNRFRLDAVVAYNALTALQRAGYFRP